MQEKAKKAQAEAARAVEAFRNFMAQQQTKQQTKADNAKTVKHSTYSFGLKIKKK